MAFQTVFKRYEIKYLLRRDQKEKILAVMEPFMSPDQYGQSTIRNIYFDTDNYRLIRESMEKPVYKEKLRIRSYAQASRDSTVFVELKKKYKHVVYKRRISLPEAEAMDWICGGAHCEKHTQISHEVDYFLQYYGNLRPTVFLSYEREAFFARDGSDFRVTFDDNILARETDLSLCAAAYGTPLLDGGTVLMELKCSGGIPLPMVQALSDLQLYKTSFSKYGTAYQTMIFPALYPNSTETKGDLIHA